MPSPEEKSVSEKEKNYNDNTPAVSTSLGESRFTTCAFIVLGIVLLPVIVRAQVRPLTSLGAIEEFSLPDFYRYPTFVLSSGGLRTDLIAYDSRQSELVLLYGNGRGIFPGRKVIAPVPQPSAVVAGNFNDDGMDDIVLVLREQNKVIIFTSIAADSSYRSNTFAVNFYPEKVIIGDLSGDTVNDIVIFGKLSSGVTVIRGKGKNDFHAPQTIFPSVPISELSIISLNADKIPDLVARKWLSNEDAFYFGIGDLQFSEQTTLSYGEDSVLSTYGDVNGDNITDVVVASMQLSALLVYHGDGLGNLTRTQIISLQGSIRDLLLSSVHSPASLDIVTRYDGKRNFSVVINDASGNFYDEIIFGLPYDRSDVHLCDIDSDGYNDVVLTDLSSGKYSIAWNYRTERSHADDARILVGADPSGVSVVDMNDDGIDDIFVSNHASNSISMLPGNRSKGSFAQLSVETATSPTNVTVYSHHDTALTLLTVHSNEQMIGVVSLNAARNDTPMVFDDVELYTIPLAGRPSYVLPDLSISNTAVSMYVFSKTAPNGITFYQQVQSTKFVAKNLSLQFPSRIIFSTISDLNNDGMTDLIYVYHDQNKRRDFLGTTLNDARGDFTGLSYSLMLPDTGVSKAFVYVEDMNGDQQKDFILYDHAQKSLSIILGKGYGDFTAPVVISSGVPVEYIHQIQCVDFDADGINDILYRENVTGVFFFLKGKGNGLFFPKQSLATLPDGSMFRCGDVNGDGSIDVVYTVPEMNAIGIRYGP